MSVFLHLKISVFIGLTFILGSIFADHDAQGVPILTNLSLEAHNQIRTGSVVYALSKKHFRNNISFDDGFSKKMFDRFVEEIDPDKTFFLASDIESLARKYETTIDNFLTQEATLRINGKESRKIFPDLEFIFDIFRTHLDRFDQLYPFISALPAAKFDFSQPQQMAIDKKAINWANDQDALEKRWYLNFKARALEGKLSEKTDADIQQNLENYVARLKMGRDAWDDLSVLALFLTTLMQNFDPHSSYISPSEMEQFEIDSSGSLTGVGLSLSQKGTHTYVDSAIKGGPAFKAGTVKKGDQIVAVRQENETTEVSIIGMPLPDSVKLIRGPVGSTVFLTIIPASAPSDSQVIAIKRERIELQDQMVKLQLIKSGEASNPQLYCQITVPSFYGSRKAGTSVSKDVKESLEAGNKLGCQGVIMDLRNNLGGNLLEVNEMAGYFIGKDHPVIRVKDFAREVKTMYTTGAKIYDGPLVVLINKMSASASEIFAAAMQDYNRGLILGGKHSFGKGSVQAIAPMNYSFTADNYKFVLDGKDLDDPVGMLRITFQMYYRANGQSIQQKGVLSDIFIPSLLASKEVISEASLDNSIPWSSVPSASFKKLDLINPELIADLKTKSAQRVQSNLFFQWLNNQIDDADDRQEAFVSLNLAERETKKQAAIQKVAQGEQLKQMVLENSQWTVELYDNGAAGVEKSKIEDLSLLETIQIMGDYLSPRP